MCESTGSRNSKTTHSLEKYKKEVSCHLSSRKLSIFQIIEKRQSRVTSISEVIASLYLACKMLFLLAVFISVAVCAPATSDYHYISIADTSKEIRRSNYSTPVTFKGVAIGVKALDDAATYGTVHALTDGHHFYQRDWYLSDVNGGSWEYLPGLRETFTSPGNTKRQVEEALLAWDVFNGNTGPIQVTQDLAIGAGGVLEDVSTIFDLPDITSAEWDVSEASSIIIDFIDDSDLVAATTALIGDLVDIFVNALEIFA